LPSGVTRRERLGLGLALAFVAAPALFWKGGVAEEEALGFLRRYWSDRPVLARVLDPRGYDDYQGRELSYAVDFLDAQWVRLFLERGRVVFVPASAALASLGVVAAFAWGVPRVLPGLDATTRSLVLLLYLSNFALLSTSGILYRATKPLVAPLLLAVLLLVTRELRRSGDGRRGSALLLFVAATAMSLLDRQGLFYLLCLTLTLGLVWAARRRGGALLLAAGAAVAAALVYNYVVGPWAIHAVNGYWPSMRFQRFHPLWLADPWAWSEGLAVLGDWTSTLLGRLPAALLAAAAVAALVVVLVGRREALRRLDPRVALLLIAGAAAQVMMVAVMARRHEPVTWIDHRIWYYPLPFQILLVFGILFGLERLAAARHGVLPRAVPIALAALVVSNVAHWPELRQDMRSGPYFTDVMRRSARLSRSLRTGVLDPLLDGDHRRFFFDCRDRFPRLASRMAPHVGEGAGVGVTGFRRGRLFAWAWHESRVTFFAPARGRYRVDGSLLLRAGETVLFAFDSTPSRYIGEVHRRAGSRGPERFSFAVDLGAGTTGVILLSRLPETASRHARRHESFGLLLPFQMRRLAPSAPAGT
jgi:hypothetical protein